MLAVLMKHVVSFLRSQVRRDRSTPLPTLETKCVNRIASDFPNVGSYIGQAG